MQQFSCVLIYSIHSVSKELDYENNEITQQIYLTPSLPWTVIGPSTQNYVDESLRREWMVKTRFLVVWMKFHTREAARECKIPPLEGESSHAIHMHIL